MIDIELAKKLIYNEFKQYLNLDIKKFVVKGNDNTVFHL